MTENNIVGRTAFESMPAYLEKRGWQVKRGISGRVLETYEVDDMGLLCRTEFCFEFHFHVGRLWFHIYPTFDHSNILTPGIIEYICRANLEIPIGCLELFFDNKGLFFNFKSGIDFSKGVLTPSLLDGVVDPALSAFDQFFPGLLWVVAGADTPAETIRRIKSGKGLGKGYEHALPGRARGVRRRAPRRQGIAAFESLSAYMKERGWRGTRLNGKFAFCVDLEEDGLPIRYALEVDVDRSQFHFSLLPEIIIVEERRAAVAEYCCHYNFGRLNVCFDFDVDVGRVSARSSIDFGDSGLPAWLIDSVVEPALKEFKHFRRRLMSVLNRRKDPYLAVFDELTY